MTEFERRANMVAYKKGDKLLAERLRKAEVENDEYEEVMNDLTWCVYYNDLGSDFGTLTVEEGYFILIETMGYDIANEFLSEHDYEDTDTEEAA